MNLFAPPTQEFKRENPTPGMVRARCFVVYDLGTHLDPKFPTKDDGSENWRHLIQVQWELDELMEFKGEKVPMVATKRYTLSAHKKSILRADAESWRGKKFTDEELKAAGGINVEKFLGVPALLNIQINDDFANVTSVNPPIKGSEAAPQFYPSRFFTLANPDPDVWAQMSKKTRDFISSSREVKSGQVKLPELLDDSKKAPL